MTDVHCSIEFDCTDDKKEIAAALGEIAREPPYARLRLWDRKQKFPLIRAALDARRELGESGAPSVLVAITAFITLVVVPVITALFWLWSLPERLLGFGPKPEKDSTSEDVPRYQVSSERPLAMTALPAVVQSLGRHLNLSKIAVTTTVASGREDDGDEEPTPTVSFRRTDFESADASQLEALAGHRIRLEDTPGS